MKSVNVQFADLSKRAGGVLLHVSSLPGQFGIGDLGPAAHQWIDVLANAGQKWWQILPLGYTDQDGSPYRCFSAFASNPLLISLEQLVKDGLLTRSELKSSTLPPGAVNYRRVSENKFRLLAIAFGRFRKRRQLQEFAQNEKAWLDDFALFMALRQADPSRSWTQWPAPLLRRHPNALKEARVQYADAIDLHRFIQFIFARQLQALRDHARAAGVALIGDLPIFISPESADVWTRPNLFQLDRNLQPLAVSGVPPDMFSATGQRWGNPLYDWKAMQKDGFSWWKARLASALKQADMVRIDHFRGLESYWRVPASCPTAQKGRWVKSPGIAFFNAMLKGHPRLPLVAEDLGVITLAVEQLRDRFNLPGMRVLQFGLSGEAGNPHTPHNYIHHCFAYTGTHDNDTVVGWYKSADKIEVNNYLPEMKAGSAWPMIRLLWGSSAGQVIVPVQDLLGLGSDTRMNTPGQSQNNWRWRLSDLVCCKEPLAELKKLTRIYDRLPVTSA